VPTDTCNEVPGHGARVHLEMGLDGHEVVSDSIGDGGLHGGRGKLGEWMILVSQPCQNLLPGLLGFVGVQTSASAHVLCLPTNSV